MSSDINFAVGGRMLRLGDIAQVRRGFSDPPQPLFRVNGEPAIGLAIAMRDGGDILALGKNIQRVMAEITTDLPLGIKPTLVADQAVTVESAIAEFMTSLWQAIAIILVVSFISLGVRPGLVIALSIPLTLAIVFSVMELARIDMQRISLGALIIALALLVDDAMTTTDAMLTRLAQGDDKVQAGDVRVPHLRLRHAGRHARDHRRLRAGRLCRQLCRRVHVLAVCRRRHRADRVLVRGGPLRAAAGRRHSGSRRPTRQTGRSPARCCSGISASSTLAMRARWVTIPLTVALFVASFLALPLVPRQFFPSSDRPELLVDLSLPQNASIFASETVARRFDAALKDDPDVERWSTYVGRGAIRFYLPLNVQLPNDFFAQAVIVAKDVAARERLRAKLEKLLAEDFPSVVARVYPLELGPPVGWPVQYRVSGPDLAQVREIALKLAQVVATNRHAVHVNFDWIEPARQVRIRIDQDEARLLGLSSQALASVLNTVISGAPVTQVRDDIYLVDVVARATDEQRVSLATLPHPAGAAAQRTDGVRSASSRPSTTSRSTR